MLPMGVTKAKKRARILTPAPALVLIGCEKIILYCLNLKRAETENHQESLTNFIRLCNLEYATLSLLVTCTE